MMTPVEFHFVTPEGVPISNTEVEIQLLQSAYDIEDSGVLMPRLVTATTGTNGKVTVNLWSTTTMYQVKVYDKLSEAGLYYKFYVPETDIPGTLVRLQDIVVTEEMQNTSFADAALVQVQTARVNAVAAQQAAQASATQAAASAQGVNTFATAAAASATAAAGSATTASTAATTATTKASESSASATGAAGSAATATTKATEASTSAAAALTSQNAAATSATGAATSATTATTKAGEAATSATSAAGSATTATNQVTVATTKAAEASASASNAAVSATNAAGSATTASTGASTATTQATAAGNSATAAQTSATNAASSASSATASKDAAVVGATTASTKASEASASASSAQTSATTASTQAGIATTKAAEAVTSATNAAGSATAASGSASTASTQATNAAASATAAQTSATNAAASQTSVATNAATATTQAGIATTKASEAAASASTASTGATTATTKASEAAASASSALAAKVAAETVRDQTLAAFDSFDDRYLGPKAIDPTVDNDGNALVGGSLYFNTNPVESGGGMKVYDGSVWRSAYASLSGALIASNNLSDLASAPAALINLGLGNVENKSSATIRGELSSSNVMTALGFTPQVELSSGTSIKTVNGQSVLGSGNIQIDGGVTSFNTRTGAITLGFGDVTVALGFTPYDAANPSNYITASALSPYLTTATAASTYQQLLGYTAANKSGDTFTGAVFTSNAGGFTANSAAKLWTDSSRGRLDLYEGAAQTKSLRVFNANGYGIVGMTSAENLELWTNGTARITINGSSGISTFAANVIANAGVDSRFQVQSSGVTQGQFQATATAVRLASNNTLPLYLSQNGVDLLDVTTTAIVGNRQFRVPNSASYSYAFVGEQTAGAGKYNLYMSGTAANYLGGSLDVVGAITQNGSQVLHAGNYSTYAQATLVSGTNIKTLNGTSVLGSGDLTVSSPPQNFRSQLGLTASSTFTAPVTGYYSVTVVGGGGGGGASAPSVAGEVGAAASGGGAGGYARKIIQMTAGQTFTATVGAGGTTSATYSKANGSAGGNSSFVGTGVNIVANGGGGGLALYSSNGWTATGGVGGTASGGDINYQGGNGGDATMGSSTAWAATGGGAVAINGARYSAGTATAGYYLYAATGGAGTGGNSGNATATTSSTSTGGGGAGGASSDRTNTFSASGSAGAASYQSWLTGLGGGAGGASNATSPSGPGGGGGGVANRSGSTSSGLDFAGGGGVASAESAATRAGSGGIGGGGGGMVTDSMVTAQGGAGSSGFILVEW